MFEKLAQWFEEHQMECVNRRLFGVDCPGCGSQTALVQLLKGDIWGSIQTYPALIPLLGLIIFAVVQLIFRFKWGAKLAKYWLVFVAFIIISSYLFKMIKNFT